MRIACFIGTNRYVRPMLPSADVYIVTNAHHTTLYVGMSNNLPTRLWEHRTKQNAKAFTAKYNVYKLVYYELFDTILEAIEREHYIKGKTRKWKEALINEYNPEWRDLTDEIMEKFHC
jgi:putative endonuclease